MAIRFLGDQAFLKFDAGKVEKVRTSLEDALRHSGRSGTLLVGLTGSCPHKMALLSDYLLSEGHKLVLYPTGMQEHGHTLVGSCLDVFLDLDHERVEWLGAKPDGFDGPPSFDVAYFTSGSTKRPKCVGVTLESLRLTTEWYRLIYRLDRDSAILTSLPFSYNFTFIAAFCQAMFGGTLLGFTGPAELHADALAQAAEGRRVVLLANPIVLEHHLQLNNGRPNRLLIDSGGAPLSRHAVERIRNVVGDLREGYGLSETCSLTHFDLVGEASSLGTVGQPMPGVRTEIRSDGEGKPALWIHSPNTCCWFESEGIHCLAPSMALATGDLGSIDPQGNLQILGRSDDSCINGFWPRQTLDAIGPELGIRCALVQHQEEHPRVRIGLNADLEPTRKEAVAERAARFLDLPFNEVCIQVNGGQPLHSIKLPRV